MSNMKECHYCGKYFELKVGYRTVKDSTWGQAYPVCSIKCQRDHEQYINEKKQKSTESSSHSTSHNIKEPEFYWKSERERWGCIIFVLLIFLGAVVVGLMAR